MDLEGTEICDWMTAKGMTCVLLKYRVPKSNHSWDKDCDCAITPKVPRALQDAQRTIRLVRARAKELNINPNKIGVIGFSAGGHLASTLGTHFDKPAINNSDNISLRPDFMALIYPVITFGKFAHLGSLENLIGKNPSQQLVDLYSNEKQVTAATPPTFLVHAEDDNVVPVENTLVFYDALLQNKVKSEMHIYAGGGHGFGLYNSTTHDFWFDRLKEWMDTNGWLK